MRIRKLSTVIATAATLALLATACSGSGGSGDDSTGGADGVSDKVLTIGMPNGPQQPNQNPLATGSASLSLGYAFAVYESLMQVNELKPTDPPTPWLAESVEWNAGLHAGRHHRPRRREVVRRRRTSPPRTSRSRSSSARTTRS